MARSPIEMMVDQACGFDLNAPRPEQRPLVLDEETKALLAVVDAAEVWWKGNRPARYRLTQHLKNPAINCHSPAERALAEAMAEWKRLGG